MLIIHEALTRGRCRRRTIDAIRLGSLPLADVALSDVQRRVVARALWTVLAARLAP